MRCGVVWCVQALVRMESTRVVHLLLAMIVAQDSRQLLKGSE
jgi:hypothetical protein